VDSPAPNPRVTAWPAYLLSALATLFWVAAALPAGKLRGGAFADDAATPLARQAWMLVPALVLLVLGPVAMTLTAVRQGQLMLLAVTDAFLALYAGLALLLRPGIPDPMEPRGLAGYALTAGLLLLGTLSVLETRRLMLGRLGPPKFGLSGLRLALCLLVLLVPASWLFVSGHELASLLAPYVYLAVSAGGARFAQTARGLAFTAALLHLGLAAHVLVTLRFSLAHEQPRIAVLGGAGQVAHAFAWGLLGLALLQVLAWVPWPHRAVAPPGRPEPDAAA
jgi:hypothetical protein